MKRTTMAMVAKAVGVHVSTVSRVLAGDPHIPKCTSDRVRHMAEKMCYRPDPVLNALNAYRTQSREVAITSSIAVLMVGWTKEDLHTHVVLAKYWAGALRKAERLGYRLEMFFYDPNTMSGERLAGILHARGIAGLLVFPLRPPFEAVSFPFSEFATVAFGFSLTHPQIHRVTSHHYLGMLLSVENLHELGYHRPALLLRRLPVRRAVMSILHGAYLVEGAFRFPGFEPLVFHACRDNAREFIEWFHEARPDVIISQVEFVHELLASANIRVPEEVSVACQIVDGSPDAAGVDQKSEAIGERGVEQVALMLMQHQVGIPEIVTHTLVEPCWRNGKSAPRKVSPANRDIGHAAAARNPAAAAQLLPG